MNLQLTSDQLSQIAAAVADQLRPGSSSLNHSPSPQPSISSSSPPLVSTLSPSPPPSPSSSTSSFDGPHDEDSDADFLRLGALLPSSLSRETFKHWLQDQCIITGHPLSVKSTDVGKDGTERLRAYTNPKLSINLVQTKVDWRQVVLLCSTLVKLPATVNFM